MVGFGIEPHVNTALVWISAIATIPAAMHGQQMRWGAVLSGWGCIMSLAISANMQNDLREYEKSCILGGAGGLAFAGLPRSGWWKIQRLVPNSVSSALGLGIASYHAYTYVWHQRRLNNGDASVNW